MAGDRVSSSADVRRVTRVMHTVNAHASKAPAMTHAAKK
jgi:hypothetical protein